MHADDKLSFPKLLAKLRKEWARYGRSKRVDPAFALETIEDRPYVQWKFTVKDSFERTNDAHEATVMIPLAHYWEVILWEQPCGQYTQWNSADAWSDIRTRRRKRRRLTKTTKI